MNKKALAITIIVLFVVCICAFKHGYNKAIKDAQLIEATNDTYYIQFGNDIHEYVD